MPAGPKIQATRWTVEFEEAAAKELGAVHYHFDPEAEGPVFSIDTPPPYPSGEWHIGAAAGYSLIDMVARSRRMLGYNVLFPWGLDRNGINIELVVEKKYNKRIHEWDREEFIKVCEREVGANSEALETIAKRLALSCDFEHKYLTDSPEYRAFTQGVFIELWKRGMIAEQLRPNNYCPVCETTIAEAEVVRENRQTVLVTVRFEVAQGGRLSISTTRPELLCAAKAVLVHPDDERYKPVHGKHARVPIYAREIPILPHPAADPMFGSGAMMICSYGDSSDVQLFRDLKLEPVAAIDAKGHMTGAAGPLQGLSVKKAREEAVRLLDEAGALESKSQVEQSFPMCDRSKSPIEIISLKEWYVRQVDWLPEVRKAAHEMAFHPDRHRQLLLDWIDSVTIDWPVSRRRYYHTEIPIWYCAACREIHLPMPGPYYRPWKDLPPFGACVKCGNPSFVGEERVFDTWMDSSNSALYVLKQYGQEFYQKNWPCSLRPQGRDIVRTWLYYSVLRGIHLTGKPPFAHVLIHGMGMDERGKKMSKSVGNIVRPAHVINTYGSDAFRLWAASEGTVGDDFRVSEERIAGAQKFLTKLHNVARLISSFEDAPRPQELHPSDAWILSELDALVARVREAYGDFRFFDVATTLRSFVWNLFAPHYLEMVKGRAYGGDESARFTLHHSLRAVLRMIAPIAPVMPWVLWRELYGGDVHAGRLPESLGGLERREVSDRLVEFNSQVWKLKKEKGLSFSQPVEGVAIPVDLVEFAGDLKAMHRIA